VIHAADGGRHEPHLFPVVAGGMIEADWHHGSFPLNIDVGEGTVADSTFCFRHFRSARDVGFRCGTGVTLWRTSIATEEDGYIEIGSDTFVSNASIVAAGSIVIGSRVFIAGGVTIVDSDFHPLEPAQRIADAIALSPGGDPARRPAIDVAPVVIEDDVWIGYNATILKGVRVGRGSVVHPGAVVVRDVAAEARVGGNPAVVMDVP
jgi:acetyltransferase-like isoleucine patch superfamily enzyme